MSQHLGSSLKVWVRGLLLFQLKGSPLQTVQGSQEFKRALGTPSERGKIQVLQCLAVFTAPLKCQGDALSLMLRKGHIFITASATGRVSLCLSPASKIHCAGGVWLPRARLRLGQGTTWRCLPQPRRGSVSSPVPSPTSPSLQCPHHYSNNWISPL